MNKWPFQLFFLYIKKARTNALTDIQSICILLNEHGLRIVSKTQAEQQLIQDTVADWILLSLSKLRRMPNQPCGGRTTKRL